jgi:2-dehydro-3-deoxyphosphogluconate aldolase/(4S)-4-hydroxy-2-oxoglutarate aldolase
VVGIEKEGMDGYGLIPIRYDQLEQVGSEIAKRIRELNVMNILDNLNKEKIMAMIRGLHPTTTDLTVDALVEGGIRFVEVTTNTEGAYPLVSRLRKEYGDTLYVGMGTVLDVSMAKQAIDAGAQFIVSPNLDIEVIEYGIRHQIDVYPGVMTPTEIVNASKAGAKAVKVFPMGSLGGPSYLKEIRAPLNHISMIASGSVGIHNLREIIAAGAFAVGMGGNLVNKQLIDAGDYAAIKKLARECVEVITNSSYGRNIQHIPHHESRDGYIIPD